MPYIKQKDRNKVDNLTVAELTNTQLTVGELNYIITKLLKAKTDKSLNYSTINELTGVLECAKLEYYRRVAVGYEVKKMEENGDV